MDRKALIKFDHKRVGYSKSVGPNCRRQRIWLPLSIGTCGLLAIVLGSSSATSTSVQDTEIRHAQALIRHGQAFKWPQPQTGSQLTVPLALPQRSDRFFTDEPPALRDRLATLDQAPLSMVRKPRVASKHKTAAGKWHEVTIESGDSLSLILSRLNISVELETLLNLDPKTEVLNSLYPGQSLHVRISDEGMEELIYEPDGVTRLDITKTSEGGFEAELRKMAIETHRVVASGRIEHSLYLAGAEAGLSDQIIMNLAELFGWDIDFARDIREGDTFTVIYEEHYRNGEKIGADEIIAAEFVNRDKVFRVVRYTDARGRTGYYRPDGRNVRRPFLRSPVELAHISSPFDLQRRHPILNTIRAHRGVDYAAPLGTPIRATSAGVVAERGVIGGYGSTIILQHGAKYTTLYGHMSAYANGTNVGQHVEQGQIIGYIGSTGLATGPHLHYEFHINGVHHDPLAVALPNARPLPRSEMQEFMHATKALTAELNVQMRHRFAMK